MLSQRKRYNYLPNTQRPSNCDLPTCSGTSNSTSIKYGSISSNNKVKNMSQSNKENYKIVDQQTEKIAQLEALNKKILDQTTQKFEKLQQNLLAVQNILTDKQSYIVNISGENQKLKNQKKQLIRVLNEKNQIIKLQQQQIQGLKNTPIQMIVKDSRLMMIKDTRQLIVNDTRQVNTQTQDSMSQKTIKPICVSTSTNTAQIVFHNNQNQTQTNIQKVANEISAKSSETQIDRNLLNTQKVIESNQTSGLNYRQKYQCLFKRALQMQDEMYRLKEELFDAKNELKTVNQEFNTYKILKQIQNIQKK